DERVPASPPGGADCIGGVGDQEAPPLAREIVADRKSRLTRADHNDVEVLARGRRSIGRRSGCCGHLDHAPYLPAGRNAGTSGAFSRGAPSPASEGSHSSQRGRYQFQSPSSFIAAGSSTPRTRVASIRTATPRPTPSSLKKTRDRVAKTANRATMTTAALVTTPAVVLIPCDTASSV